MGVGSPPAAAELSGPLLFGNYGMWTVLEGSCQP
jgi:hypothetical protein